MMQREYYYLIAGLPDLFIDQESKGFNLVGLKEEMQELMHPKDYSLVELFFLEYDNHNFLNQLLNRKQEFIPVGKFSEDFFKELDDNYQELPSYMQEFYLWYKNKQKEENESDSGASTSDDQAEKSPEVLFQEYFFDFIQSYDNRFISQWYSFKRDLNNILTAINCRKHDVNIESQLIGKGDLVDTLARSQTPDFGLKKEVDYLDNILQISELDDILERERRIDTLKWEKADDLTTFDYFNAEKVLSFVVKAGIVYRWTKLDAKVGKEMFKKLVTELRETYQLPKEFAK
ncbi:MAG: DUF2764 family protein [Bacteroidales bacterium]